MEIEGITETVCCWKQIEGETANMTSTIQKKQSLLTKPWKRTHMKALRLPSTASLCRRTLPCV